MQTAQLDETKAVRSLYEASGGKVAPTRGYRKGHRLYSDDPEVQKAKKHKALKFNWTGNADALVLQYQKGHAVATNPRNLGALVVDVDHGSHKAVIEAFGRPFAMYRTSRDEGVHLWYKAPNQVVGNKEYSVRSEEHGYASGDIRCDSGHVLIHDVLKVARNLHRMDDAEPFDPSLIRKVKVPQKWTEGSRNNTLYRHLSRSYRTNDTELREWAVESALLSGLTQQEIAASDESARKSEGTGSKKGVIKVYDRKDELVLADAFKQLGIEYMHDTRADMVLYRGLEKYYPHLRNRHEYEDRAADDYGEVSSWTPLTPGMEGKVKGLLSRHFQIRYGDGKEPIDLKYSKYDYEDFHNSMTEAAQGDMFLRWLDDLPDWNDEYEAEYGNLGVSLLHEMYGVEQTLSTIAFKKLFGAAVARAYVPGIASDEAVILKGKKGYRKTRFFEYGLPKAGDWVHLGMKLNQETYDEAAETGGMVWTVFDELKGRASEITHQLDMLAKGSLRTRKRFFKYAKTIHRQYVFAGTTNDDNCVANHDAMTRRLVICECTKQGSPREHLLDRRRVANTDYPSLRSALWKKAQWDYLTLDRKAHELTAKEQKHFISVAAENLDVDPALRDRLTDIVEHFKRGRNREFHTENWIDVSGGGTLQVECDPYESGLSLEFLAVRLGIAKDETERIKPHDITTIRRLAEVLGWTVKRGRYAFRRGSTKMKRQRTRYFMPTE